MLKGHITDEPDWSKGLAQLGNLAVPAALTITLRGVLDEPDCVIKYEVRDGRADCVSFTVTAKPNGRGLLTSDLRMFTLDGLGEEAFTDYAYDAAVGGEQQGLPDERAARRTISDSLRASRGPSLAVLEEVARLYRENPKRPVVAVETALGISRSTAHRRIREARAKGLL